jgi:DNA-binding transcriptional LysR family regulator
MSSGARQTKNMTDLIKIETFLRAAETLNFSETAKQLHMS